MEWLDVFKGIVYGIVEGITEWLPVSSTGHLILLERWMPLTSGTSPDQAAAFFSMFLVVIQLGAILAVVVAFWRELWPFAGRRALRTAEPDAYLGSGGLLLKRRTLRLWGNILVACLPAAVVGLFFQDWFEAHFYRAPVVAIMLIVVGVAFILTETYLGDKKPLITDTDQIDWKLALYIGLFQLIAAIFPGTSRSGATILGGLLLGMSRPAAASFTFLLAVPVMFGASFLKLVRYEAGMTQVQIVTLLIGMAVAYVVSELVIKFLLGYIRKHDFKPFGWYRIALGLVVLLISFTRVFRQV